MSREVDTTMKLRREDWEEMWPHIQAVMFGAEEAALRTSIEKIVATLADFPQARDEFLRILYNPLATASTNSLTLFVTLAKKMAFERAMARGTRLLEGGYAEWDILDEVGNVSSRPQFLDPLSTYILTNFIVLGLVLPGL